MIRPMIAAALAAACLLTVPAQAQERHHRQVRTAVRAVAPPLTVSGRSWLDSGNVVPVHTQDSYLAESTTLNQPIYRTFAPDRFGESTLPGPFDLAFSNDNPRGPQSGGIFFDSEP